MPAAGYKQYNTYFFIPVHIFKQRTAAVWLKTMHTIARFLETVDNMVWGPPMLALLCGTGIYLSFKTHFLPVRNLGYALKSTLGKDARSTGSQTGDISAFSALTTALAATIGTGNIVGVATAMVIGGPGAILWMILSAVFGMTTKFAECMLAVKYRSRNARGEMCGGPMYTIQKTFQNKTAACLFARMFALFAVIASFGIGNLTQSNSISSALRIACDTPDMLTGLILTILVLLIIIGGIKNISKVSSYIVPLMAIGYMLMGIAVLIGNRSNLADGIIMILHMAFSPQAVGGGLCGSITVSMSAALRCGIARGCFSNEAGMGSAAISAAAAASDDPVRQGYINMTGTFWDTIVVCTMTGLCIASSGMLGQLDPATGEYYTGVSLTIAAFETVLGPFARYAICISITLFAFSTILGWEYQGEKAFEYLVKTHRFNLAYRILFSFAVYVGATTPLQIVWSFSDIANALMCLPNLVCLLHLRNEIAQDVLRYQIK